MNDSSNTKWYLRNIDIDKGATGLTSAYILSAILR